MVLLIFKQRFFNRRVSVLFILLLLVMHIYISPVKRFTVAVQYNCSPWLFIFLAGNMYFLILFLLGVVYYYTNVPFLHKESMYQLIRTGRMRWTLTQVGCMLLGAVSITGAFILFSLLLLLPDIIVMGDWGKILHTLSLTNTGEKYGVLFAVPYEIIKNYSPINAGLLIVSISILIIFLIGNLMFCLSLCFSRIVAIAASMVGIVAIIMQENMYLFPNMFLFTPFAWVRMEKYTSVDISAMKLIILLVILNTLLIGTTIMRMRKVDIHWNDEAV